MNFDEIKNMTVVELAKKTKEIRNNLFQAKMKNALGQLANPLEIRGLRRDVARMLTSLNQKKLVDSNSQEKKSTQKKSKITKSKRG